MRVIVMGAGIVGVASAYFLHCRGHEVTVLDRQAGPALETSFSNAGHVCPSYATPWAAPGMKSKALAWSARGWMGMETALRWTPRIDAHQWQWLRRFLGECNAQRFAANKARMGRIARYSHVQLKAIRERLALDYEQTTEGNLQVFRDHAGLAKSQLASRVLTDAGVAHRLMSVDECTTFDPALAQSRAHIVGGLLMPDDETGDCRIFASRLAAWLAGQGVRFEYGTRILAIAAHADTVDSLETATGLRRADAYVLSCASDSVALARPLGLRLPICPVKGYAITAPIRDHALAPRSGIMDESLKVAITRMGATVRAAGTAEIGARDASASAAQCATIFRSVRTLFGGGVDLSKASTWAGFRPMTPDGAPIVGPTRHRNLHLATGGGSNGWTTACGIGRVVADQISGVAPEIETGDLGIARFG